MYRFPVSLRQALGFFISLLGVIDWRTEMFRIHTQVRHGNLPWINSAQMQLQALENLKAAYPLLAAADCVSLVKSTWHNMNAFTGASETINRLRTKYVVVVLTILSLESIVKSSKAAGIQWDSIDIEADNFDVLCRELKV